MRALVLARVLHSRTVREPRPGERWWRNALHTLKRIDAVPLGHARVLARQGGAVHELRADDEGFVSDWISIRASSVEAGWVEVGLQLDHHDAADGERTARILVPDAAARYGVISDLDDTVLQSEVGSALRAARLILFENALTRLPFPGVAAFYRALAIGAGGTPPNPLFYVSSSPWNLYDVIDRFLDVQRIPSGPLLLRDWDIGRALRSHDHKRERIREIFSTYSGLPFILIGDSTQEDPEIYSELVHDYPGRILAVYIRNVRAHAERAASIAHLAAEVHAAGSSLVLADDTVAAARHAILHGWIDRGALDDVAEEEKEDTGVVDGKAAVPGAEAPRAPTVVVDDELAEGEKRDIVQRGE